MTDAPLDVEKCRRMMDLYNAKDTPAVQAFGVPVIDTLTQLCAALTLLAEARMALDLMVHKPELLDVQACEKLLSSIPDLSELKL